MITSEARSVVIASLDPMHNSTQLVAQVQNDSAGAPGPPAVVLVSVAAAASSGGHVQSPSVCGYAVANAVCSVLRLLQYNTPQLLPDLALVMMCATLHRF
jgi:hypothetical protein